MNMPIASKINPLIDYLYTLWVVGVLKKSQNHFCVFLVPKLLCPIAAFLILPYIENVSEFL